MSEFELEVDAVTVAYGAIVAVSEVSLNVAASEMVALLGPNGSGKTSLLNCISGLVRPRSGGVRFAGSALRPGTPHAVHAGLIHVPEGRRVIGPLTVHENLLLAGGSSHRRRGRDLTAGLDEVYQLFPRLAERRTQPSGFLSGGEQQMLALGRAIIAKPRVLLLDEPSMGLAPVMVDEIYKILRSRQGTLADTAILLAEQSAALALDVCSRGYVLGRGRVVAAGPTQTLSTSALNELYFGQESPG